MKACLKPGTHRLQFTGPWSRVSGRHSKKKKKENTKKLILPAPPTGLDLSRKLQPLDQHRHCTSIPAAFEQVLVQVATVGAEKKHTNTHRLSRNNKNHMNSAGLRRSPTVAWAGACAGALRRIRAALLLVQGVQHVR